MTFHAIVKQIAEQLKGHVPISKEEGYSEDLVHYKGIS